MKTTLLYLLLICVLTISSVLIPKSGFTQFSQSTEMKYSLVNIQAANENDFRRISNTGLIIDHMESIDENNIKCWLSEEEIKMLKKSGVTFRIVVPDWKTYFDNLPKMTESEITSALIESKEKYSVSHSIYGSMGGYLTLDEVIRKLDSMRLEFPNLISQKFSIGNSIENRPVWTVRVSNSPNAPTGRPEVWIHSLIHAREPVSMMQSIYFIYWLLENYNINPLATYILRYREIYFTPVFNPDGYEYNRQTNPNGGGMWRKNRRNNGGSYGVDLNRNYGTYQFWNSSNGGSSTSPSSETYRGTSPFSEPETQNAMNFVISRNFKSILSYHTYGNYFIRPWGWVDAPTPDEHKFTCMSADMIQHNHFTVGRAMQTVAYGVRGVTDDWYYTDSAHSSALAMTPEVGSSSDGFWPPQSRIMPLVQSVLWSNIYFAMTAGGYVAPENIVLSKMQYTPGESGNIKIHFKNKGFMNSQNVKIELSSPSPYINVSSVTYNYNFVNSYFKDSLLFNFNILSTCPNNKALPVLLKIKQNDTSLVHTETIYIPVGAGTVTLLDSAENSLTKFSVAGGWGITSSQYYSPSNSFTDSPSGNYPASATGSMTLINPINITNYPVTFISFWHKYTIDSLDYAYVDVSSDGGTSWQSIKYFMGTQSSWKQEFLDITALANSSSNLRIKFSLVSNKSVQTDGWYIDNIKMTNYIDVLTSISSNETLLKFELLQNYPNPFNPSTNIEYSLAKVSFVQLKIYDILGREVKTLVNEFKPAGKHIINYDASNMPSGVYFYQIFAEDKSGNQQLFSETKRMMLVK